MLKFDIRKQPNIPHLTDILVDKLVEEANEVKEALYDNDINGNAYIQELLDVQQTLFAIFGNYKNHDTFGIIEHAMEEHNKKLATSHKEKYNLGDIQYIGYVDLNKPGDDPIEKLENKCENYSKQLKELINKYYDVKNTNRVQEAKIEELRGIISNLKENIDRKNKELNELQYSKDKLVEENINLKYKLSTETAADQNKKLEFLEKKYNLSMEANRQLREEIQTLRIENGEYRDIINRIENYINELKTQQMD